MANTNSTSIKYTRYYSPAEIAKSEFDTELDWILDDLERAENEKKKFFEDLYRQMDEILAAHEI